MHRILEGVCAKILEATLLFVDFSKAFASIYRGKISQRNQDKPKKQKLPKETATTIMTLYKNTKVKVRSPDGDTNFFDIVVGVIPGDTFAPYLFIICLDNVLRKSIDLMKVHGFTLKRQEEDDAPHKLLQTQNTQMT